MKPSGWKTFILFWSSQSLSQLGSAMTGYALILWAYRQTGSALTLSLMAFFTYLPYVLVSPFAGSFVDSHDKKRVMLFADAVAFLSTGAALVLFMTDSLAAWHIYLINAVSGVMGAFQSPASGVSVGLIAPADKLDKALGLNSLSQSAQSIITPMLAAFIMSFWGFEGVILIDMATFIVAFSALAAFIRIPDARKACEKIAGGAREGFRFLFRHKGLLYIILSMAFMNFLSRLTYENILPAMLLDRSMGNERVFGLVSGVMGLGGVLGGLYVSARGLPKKKIRCLFTAAALSFLLGDVLMGLGRSTIAWCFAGLCASAPIPLINSCQSVTLYKHVPKDIQGRVFAARNAMQFATIPIGLLAGGTLAERVFEPFMLSGAPLAAALSRIGLSGDGSGMALMFLITGTLGFLFNLTCYISRDVRALDLVDA